MFANHEASNVDRALTGWGSPLPDWVRLLAEACDRSSQGAVGERLGTNGPFVSKVLRRVYAGSYPKAEQLVRARLGAEVVDCPAWGRIPLASCRRIRLRKAPPANLTQRACAETCPTCPNNPDRKED